MAAASGAGDPILIVDEDAAFASSLAEILAEQGYRAVTAATAAEALAQLRSAPEPVLLIVDAALGAEELRALREGKEQDAGLARLPVVTLSASGQTGEGAVGPVVARLEKPVELGVLLEVISRHGGHDLAARSS